MTTRILIRPSGIIEFYDISSETVLGMLYFLTAPVAQWQTAQEAKNGLQPWKGYNEETWTNDLLHRNVPVYLIDLYGRQLNENMAAISRQTELIKKLNDQTEEQKPKSFGTRALMPFALTWDAEKFIVRLRISNLRSVRPTPADWFRLVPIDFRPFIGIK